MSPAEIKVVKKAVDLLQKSLEAIVASDSNCMVNRSIGLLDSLIEQGEGKE